MASTWHRNKKGTQTMNLMRYSSRLLLVDLNSQRHMPFIEINVLFFVLTLQSADQQHEL